MQSDCSIWVGFTLISCREFKDDEWGVSSTDSKFDIILAFLFYDIPICVITFSVFWHCDLAGVSIISDWACGCCRNLMLSQASLSEVKSNVPTILVHLTEFIESPIWSCNGNVGVSSEQIASWRISKGASFAPCDLRQWGELHPCSSGVGIVGGDIVKTRLGVTFPLLAIALEIWTIEVFA